MLKNCDVIHNVSIDVFDFILSKCREYFPHYDIKYSKLFEFLEEQEDPDDNENFIFISRYAECGADFLLKNCPHDNFNFKIIFYENSLYFIPGVYYYGDYVLHELFRFANFYVNINNCDDEFQIQTYKNWIDKHIDQRDAKHNYLIDKEDLERLGILV
jgi:hypothetical protein